MPHSSLVTMPRFSRHLLSSEFTGQVMPSRTASSQNAYRLWSHLEQILGDTPSTLHSGYFAVRSALGTQPAG